MDKVFYFSRILAIETINCFSDMDEDSRIAATLVNRGLRAHSALAYYSFSTRC